LHGFPERIFFFFFFPRKKWGRCFLLSFPDFSPFPFFFSGGTRFQSLFPPFSRLSFFFKFSPLLFFPFPPRREVNRPSPSFSPPLLIRQRCAFLSGLFLSKYSIFFLWLRESILPFLSPFPPPLPLYRALEILFLFPSFPLKMVRVLPFPLFFLPPLFPSFLFFLFSFFLRTRGASPFQDVLQKNFDSQSPPFFPLSFFLYDACSPFFF